MGFPQYNILDDGDLEEIAQTIYIDGVRYVMCESDNTILNVKTGEMMGTYIDNKWSFYGGEKHILHLKNILYVLLDKYKDGSITREEFLKISKRHTDKMIEIKERE